MNGAGNSEVAHAACGGGRCSGALPTQNYVLAVAIIAAVTGVAWWLNAHTGFPLGRWAFMVAPGARLPLGFPVWLPGLAVLALLSARGTARLLLEGRPRGRNHGLWLLALSSALATLTHTAADLVATRRLGWWAWASELRWNGIALWPIVGTWGVLTLALALATPALLDKRSNPRPTPRRAWLAWFVPTLLAAVAALGCASDAAVAVLAAPTLLVGALAFQRSRDAAPDCALPATPE